MRKKALAILLAALMVLASVSAIAEGSPASPTADGMNSVYITNLGEILNSQGEKLSTLTAQTLLYVGETGVCYIARTATGMLRLVYETPGKRPSVYASSIAQAAYVAAHGLVYYTLESDPLTVYRCTPLYGVSARACVLSEPIAALGESIDGLLIATVDAAQTARTYILKTGVTAPVETDIAREYCFPGCSVQLLNSGVMQLVFQGMQDYSLTVDSDPVACAFSGNTLFYLKDTEENMAAQLNQYATDTASGKELYVFAEPMYPALATDGSYVYALNLRGGLVAVNVATGALTTLNELNTLTDPSLYRIGDSLYVYDSTEEGVALSTVYAVKADERSVTFTKQEIAAPITTATPAPTATPVPTVAPAATPTPAPIELKLGSRSDEVKTLQQALIRLGYLKDKADGVFGNKTLRAVKLVQEALELEETGIVDRALLEEIYADTVPEYDAYRPLTRGDSGTRVNDLQKELYDNGYIAEAADGEYGANTEAAVKRLQEELGYRQTGAMSRELMEYVYNNKMPEYSDYIPLSKGSVGPRVEEMQRRLRNLKYYEGAVNGTYDSVTESAVALFEETAGRRRTGNASVAVLQALFSRNAPSYVAPDPTPTPDPSVINSNSPIDQIVGLQQKLYAIGKLDSQYVTGVYNRETKYAVAYIQLDMRNNMGIDVKATGHADSVTQAWIDSLLAQTTPAPVPTTAPTTAPTAPTTAPTTTAPTAVPTTAPTYNPLNTPSEIPTGDTISSSSPREQIFDLQQKLFALGWIVKPEVVTGKYNEETKYAVAYLQRDIKEYYGVDVSPNGHADDLTQQWLMKLYGEKSPSEIAYPPVVFGEVVDSFTAMLNEWEKSVDPSFTPHSTLTAVEWLKTVLLKWGYKVGTSNGVYDKALFDQIVVLRNDMAASNPDLLVGINDISKGVVDGLLFEYVKLMFTTDVNNIPAGSPLKYKG